MWFDVYNYLWIIIDTWSYLSLRAHRAAELCWPCDAVQTVIMIARWDYDDALHVFLSISLLVIYYDFMFELIWEGNSVVCYSIIINQQFCSHRGWQFSLFWIIKWEKIVLFWKNIPAANSSEQPSITSTLVCFNSSSRLHLSLLWFSETERKPSLWR